MFRKHLYLYNMNFPYHLSLHTYILIFLLLISNSVHANHHIILPELGDPSYTTMNVAQEKKLGQAILTKLRSQLKMINNIELRSYVRRLGQSISAKINHSDIDFHFLLVNNKNINAFATPGGIIALNSGLILVGESEDEVAGVVAHEIAHVNRRHISRLYSLSNQSQWYNALALIIGVIGASYNTDLGQAGIASAISLPLERQLYYSRIFEREADYFGMNLLARAGYSPQGMVDFFNKLQQLNKGHQIPEFLRTHPLGIERLNNMQQRAQQYPSFRRRNQNKFKYMQAMLRAISTPASVFPDEEKHIQIYRNAIILIEKNFPSEAIQTLKQIKAPHSEDLEVKLAMARALFADNKSEQAYSLLTKLKYSDPYNVSINYYLAKLLLDSKRAKEALDILQNIATLNTYYPILIKLRAQSYSLLNKKVETHETLSDYYSSFGKFELALNHLKLAAKHVGNNSISEKRIMQKRKSIIALKKALQDID